MEYKIKENIKSGKNGQVQVKLKKNEKETSQKIHHK